VVGAGRDGRVAVGRVHQLDDFLGNGTEVRRYSASSDLLVTAVEVASSDPECEDPEEGVRPRDP